MPCLLWSGATDSSGYGNTRRAGRMVGAHRAAYEDAYGSIPAGLQIDHLCRQRNCVEPTHLEAVTQQENIRRGNKNQNGATLVCIRGHFLLCENLYRTPDGRRQCKTCQRERVRLFQQRRD